jgi:hypothetical protein
LEKRSDELPLGRFALAYCTVKFFCCLGSGHGKVRREEERERGERDKEK